MTPHYRIKAALFNTIAAIMAPCSVNTEGSWGENLSRSRGAQIVTSAVFSTLVSFSGFSSSVGLEL
jgi:hypothetical protein